MRIVFILLMHVLLLPAFSQEDSIRHPDKSKGKKDKFWSADKIVFGGDIGASFGSFTLVNISPMIGYKVTDRFVPGVTAIYQYIRIRDRGITIYESNVYGAAGFARYYVLDYIFAHSEYQWLNGHFDPNQPKLRINTQAVLLGGGVNYAVGTGSSIFIMGLWDVLGDPYYPYPSPVIRGGITVGI